MLYNDRDGSQVFAVVKEKKLILKIVLLSVHTRAGDSISRLVMMSRLRSIGHSKLQLQNFIDSLDNRLSVDSEFLHEDGWWS
jgi:hypothetical protein